jgi:uncharacterized protein (TIGR02145 family)
MTRNLDVACFKNGDPIMEARASDDWGYAAQHGLPAWCYYENNHVYGKKFGKLYNWYAVNDPRGLAPDSWHIPSLMEWEEMVQVLSEDGHINVNATLKGGKDWQPDYEMNKIFRRNNNNNDQDNDDFSALVNALFGDDDGGKSEGNENFEEENIGVKNESIPCGFNALPGGGRGRFGNAFFAKNDSAYWWTSTAFEEEGFEDNAYFVLLYENDETLQTGNYNEKKLGFSVRCVREKSLQID